MAHADQAPAKALDELARATVSRAQGAAGLSTSG